VGDAQGARRAAAGSVSAAVRLERDRKSDLARAFGEHVLVGNADQLARQLVACQLQAQFRADACRLARG
jgi:hypothetical protein